MIGLAVLAGMFIGSLLTLLVISLCLAAGKDERQRHEDR